MRCTVDSTENGNSKPSLFSSVRFRPNQGLELFTSCNTGYSILFNRSCELVF